MNSAFVFHVRAFSRAAIVLALNLGIATAIAATVGVHAQTEQFWVPNLNIDSDFGNKSLDPRSFPMFKSEISECGTEIDDVPGAPFFGLLRLFLQDDAACTFKRRGRSKISKPRLPSRTQQ